MNDQPDVVVLSATRTAIGRYGGGLAGVPPCDLAATVVREAMRQSGMFEACIAGVVLSGGGSRLPGLLDIAESVLRKPVRLSWPVPLAKMPVELAEPEFATLLGLVYYGHRARVARGIQDDRWSSKIKAMFAKKGA